MARHAPSGQLVALKRTNLDECAEEELLQLMVRVPVPPPRTLTSDPPPPPIALCFCVRSNLGLRVVSPPPQNEVLLSRLFRHSNLLTSRLVFSSCCQLWVLMPLMTYGPLPPLPFLLFLFLLIQSEQRQTAFSFFSCRLR